MKFRGAITNDGLAFDSFTLNRRKLYLQSIKAGTAIVEEIKRDRSSKTQKQLGSIFGHFCPRIRARMEELGISLFGVTPSKDGIKEILYKCCGGVGEHGSSKRLSGMDIAEVNQFIENIMDFCVTQLDFNPGPPDPNWRNNFKE